jgi:hypothetical protein
MNNLKSFPSPSNISVNQENKIPTTPNGRLVKLARLDEDSTDYAIKLLSGAGGGDLKTVKYRGLTCTTPPIICKVFDVKYHEVSNIRSQYGQYFEKLGLITVEDEEKITQIYDELNFVKRGGRLSVYSLQVVIFLLLGMKNNIAGDILRHDISIGLERYSKLFDMAAIRVDRISKSDSTSKPDLIIKPAIQVVDSKPESVNSSGQDSVLKKLQDKVDLLLREREELTREIDNIILGLNYAIDLLKDSKN